jgi:hypothetical protein
MMVVKTLFSGSKFAVFHTTVTRFFLNASAIIISNLAPIYDYHRQCAPGLFLIPSYFSFPLFHWPYLIHFHF